jgi:VanZ family protein
LVVIFAVTSPVVAIVNGPGAAEKTRPIAWGSVPVVSFQDSIRLDISNTWKFLSRFARLSRQIAYQAVAVKWFCAQSPRRLRGEIIMASSPIVLGTYPLPASAGRSVRWQFHLLTWLPVLACSMIFAIESTSYFGADRTSEPLRRVAEALFGYDVCVQWDLIHHIIRKTGHFMGYGFFSLVCFRGFWMEFQGAAIRLLRQLRAHGLAILATFLVACADEIHQSFLPNRTGLFSDVLLDTCGALAVGLALFLAMLAAEWLRQTRARAIRHRELACVDAAA